MMNSLLKNALKALHKHYSRILLINRKLNTYYPICLESNEKEWDKIGCLTEFATWFMNNGNIHTKDRPLFKKFIQECFVEGQDTYIFYRRKQGEQYRWAFCFVEQGEKPDEEFLYVRDINDIYLNQCDLILDSVGEVDPLTSFGNRYCFEKNRKKDDDITFVKVDNLGAINCECGYDVGDEIISKVVEIIDEYDVDAYRISGSTFALRNLKHKNCLIEDLEGLATVI